MQPLPVNKESWERGKKGGRRAACWLSSEASWGVAQEKRIKCSEL